MIRSRLFRYVIVPVILVGLLIFFNGTPPVRFMRAQIFRIAEKIIGPVHMLRVRSVRFFSSGSLEDAGLREQQDKRMAAEAALQELTRENEQLRTALGFKERNKIPLMGAQVRSYGYEFGKEFLLIDKGTRDHVAKGDAVVDANGLLLGMIGSVEDEFAKVSIASNAEEVFDAELLPAGVKTFAKGLGSRAFSLELLPQNAVIRNGDYVMAKGFRTSFLLGQVARVETNGGGAFKEVHAVLVSHPELSEEVFILSGK